MHVLAVNSVSTLLNYLSEQLENTPSTQDIQGWNKETEEEVTQEENEFDAKVCLYTCEKNKDQISYRLFPKNLLDSLKHYLCK